MAALLDVLALARNLVQETAQLAALAHVRVLAHLHLIQVHAPDVLPAVLVCLLECILKIIFAI